MESDGLRRLRSRHHPEGDTERDGGGARQRDDGSGGRGGGGVADAEVQGVSGIDIRDTKSNEVSAHANFSGWGKTY